MCPGRKWEVYLLLPRSGKEAFLSEGSEQLGGGGRCSKAGSGLSHPKEVAELQQLGTRRTGFGKTDTGKGACRVAQPPCLASVFSISGDSSPPSRASPQRELPAPLQGPSLLLSFSSRSSCIYLADGLFCNNPAGPIRFVKNTPPPMSSPCGR